MKAINRLVQGKRRGKSLETKNEISRNGAANQEGEGRG